MTQSPHGEESAALVLSIENHVNILTSYKAKTYQKISSKYKLRKLHK